ncbi:MAG: hypothetical protein QXL94_02205 [Candidatus Parvarchaeum sp.]
MKIGKEFVDLSMKKKKAFEYYYFTEVNSKRYIAKEVLWQGISFTDVEVRSIDGKGDFLVELNGINFPEYKLVFLHSFEEVLSLLLINAYHRIHGEDGNEDEDKKKAIQEVFHISVA